MSKKISYKSHLRTILLRTILHPELELTRKEFAETLKFKEGQLKRYQKFNERESIRDTLFTTTNHGIHHLVIVENDQWMCSELAYNPHISFDFVMKISNAIHTARELLMHPTVANDIDNFKQLWNSLSHPWSDFGFLKFTDLKEFDIKIIMFLINEWIKPQQDCPYRTVEELVHMMAFLRKTEISEWFAKNNPDLGGLPFAWMMQAYGLKGWDESVKENWREASYDYLL